MHIDEGANVQLCQSVRGQMSLHAIFGQGANVRGGTCPTLILDMKINLNIESKFSSTHHYKSVF